MIKFLRRLRILTTMKSQMPLHVLLADDDQDDCIFFDRALQELESNTFLTTVNDGEELMKYLKDDSTKLPDVLFLDINMPRKSGTECLVEIKQIEKLKSLPVIMFSTSNDFIKIKFHFKVGANVFIHKPSDFSQLKEVIFHALPMTLGTLSLHSDTKFILNA